MITIINGDCREMLKTLPDQSVHCCVTSPPYFGLRDYGHDGQIGLEQTPDAYVAELVAVFREVKRVLRDDGTLWLNLGDSYAREGSDSYGVGKNALVKNQIEGRCKRGSKPPAGLKHKDLIGIPWRVAFALQADGWYLRQDIIWHKPNPMPESVTDRCTKAHEYIFLLSKSARYYFDNKAIMEPAQYGEQHASKATSWGTNRKHPNKANVDDYAFAGDNHTTSKMEDGSYGRNKRSVWTVTTKPYKGAHFATFPPDLITPCILAGCPSKICAKCGAPWERITESTKTFESGSGRSGNPINGKQDLSASDTNSTPDIRKGPVVHTRTIGHRTTCECNGATTSGTVLDPFGGSGATGEVAESHGRNAVLIELNPAYIDLIKERTKQQGLGI
jgi:DNA modification methylase